MLEGLLINQYIKKAQCFKCLIIVDGTIKEKSETYEATELGGQVVMWGLTDLPKPEWTIAHPAHPSPTSLEK